MNTSSAEERLASIEATLPHLATKADLKALEMRLAGMVLGVGAVIVAVPRLWQ